jgi:lipopolysaccharide transport system permease protein
VALVDFFIAFVIFIILLFIYKIEINFAALLLLPLSILITCLSSMGCGLLLAALNVKYRDVRYIIPFLVQGLLFLTPIMYPIGISDNKIVQYILMLNPLSGALELMRGLFVGYSINTQTVFLSLTTSVLLFIIGVIYFRKTESYFADLV